MIIVATLLFVLLIGSWLLAPNGEPVVVEAEALVPGGQTEGVVT